MALLFCSYASFVMFRFFCQFPCEHDYRVTGRGGGGVQKGGDERPGSGIPRWGDGAGRK